MVTKHIANAVNIDPLVLTSFLIKTVINSLNPEQMGCCRYLVLQYGRPLSSGPALYVSIKTTQLFF